MSGKRRILLVFPHNFYEGRSGVHKRFFELARFLHSRGIVVDLLGLRHFESSWKDFGRQNREGLISRLFLYDFRKGYHLDRLTKWITRNPEGTLPDFAFPGMQRMFDRILRENRYDIVVIGYAYWAGLITGGLPEGTVSVLTIEDFLSRKMKETAKNPFDFDASAKEEVEMVGLFDRVICLSYEEMQYFSSRTRKPEYFFVPVFMDEPVGNERTPEYDLLFTGYDNEDNIGGMDWFFSMVYPLLPAGLKIVIIGEVSRYVPDLPGVTRLESVPDLSDFYHVARVSLNPLRKGTGMKVKVVEALSFGIPVVSTSAGLCGMPPEILDQFIIADDPELFARAIMRLLTDNTWYGDRCRLSAEIFRRYFSKGAVTISLDKAFQI